MDWEFALTQYMDPSHRVCIMYVVFNIQMDYVTANSHRESAELYARTQKVIETCARTPGRYPEHAVEIVEYSNIRVRIAKTQRDNSLLIVRNSPRVLTYYDNHLSAARPGHFDMS